MFKARKYIPFLLIILISLLFNTGFIPTALKEAAKQAQSPDGKPVPFNDINSHWAGASISEMYLKDIMKGYPDNTFRPNSPITKIQAVVMLVRVLGLEPNTELADDLPYLQETFHIPVWANGYVITALNEKLVYYDELESVGLQKPLTRQDAARLVIRALGLSKEAERYTGNLKFVDAKSIQPEFAGYISTAVEKDLMSANAEGAFQPLNPVTRGEIAVIFSRADNFLPEDKRETVGEYVYKESEQHGELTIVKNDTEVTIKLTDNYLLFRDSSPALWQELLPGDRVKVVKNTRDEGVLVLVTSTPKPEAKTIPFENLNLDATSVALQNFVTKNKNSEDYFIYSEDDCLYVLVTRGEKPNSGYGVEITKVTGLDTGKTRDLEITVVKTDPKPGFFYTPVLSYRYSLAKISLDGNEQGEVHFVDSAGRLLKEIP